MPRDMPFVFYDAPYTYRGRYTKQQLNNEYYYETLARINIHMALYGLTFEWKLNMIRHLEMLCGKPVKLTWWQNALANFLML